MGAFVIAPLPPVLANTRCAVRPLRSMGITPLPRYSEPSRHRLAVSRFPGVSGYTAYPVPPIPRWDEDGFSSCSTCPCHRADSFSRCVDLKYIKNHRIYYVYIKDRPPGAMPGGYALHKSLITNRLSKTGAFEPVDLTANRSVRKLMHCGCGT